MSKVFKLIDKNYDNTVLLHELKVADSFFQRFLGLMGKTLKDSEGLLIKPCNSIHCFFMKIPIDVLFLDKDNVVVHKIGGLRPWKISPVVKKAKAVVEGPEGAFHLVQVGDLISLE